MKIKSIKKLANTISKILRETKNIENTIKRNSLKLYLENEVLKSDSLLTDKRNENIVISLTTYSKRIKDIHLVIESLGRQTVKAGEIILWLDEKEFNLNQIPISLKSQMNRGLTINFCKNYRSYKKLIPTLEKHPQKNIITVDDDVLYPIYFIEQLCNEAISYPDTVICYRAHKMKKNSRGEILPYKEWEHKTKSTDPSFDIFPTGVGGVYYPLDTFNSECGNYDAAERLAPYADDVWFKAMSIVNGKKSKLVAQYYDYDADFIDLIETQDIALNNKNCGESYNDVQLKRVFEEYKI